MTTKEAAARYTEEYLSKFGDRKAVIYNPQNLPVDSLPFIFAFNNGGSDGLLIAISISQDGFFLGQHCCSNEAYMPGDLGVFEGTRKDRHQDSYQVHYPNGYRMAFIPYDKVPTTPELLAAFKLVNERDKKEGEANGETQG